MHLLGNRSNQDNMYSSVGGSESEWCTNSHEHSADPGHPSRNSTKDWIHLGNRLRASPLMEALVCPTNVFPSKRSSRAWLLKLWSGDQLHSIIWNVLEMQNLRPHPRPPESESSFWQELKWFKITGKSKNHYSRVCFRASVLPTPYTLSLVSSSTFEPGTK